MKLIAQLILRGDKHFRPICPRSIPKIEKNNVTYPTSVYIYIWNTDPQLIHFNNKLPDLL